jgi:hypothetical protein
MPNYFGLADQINKLSDRVAGLGSDRMAHEERMAGLGLTGVQLDNQRTAVQGQRQSELAKMEYEKYLDEPITVGSAISTSKRSAQEKRQMMETLKPFLNEPTTRRGFFERVNSAREQAMEAQKMKATEEYRKKQLQLDRDQIRSAEKIAGMRTSAASDNRPNIQKEVEYIASVLGINQQDALKKYQSDKALPERIRLYNNELELLRKDDKFQYDLTEQQKEQKINELRSRYKIDEISGKQEQQSKWGNRPDGSPKGDGFLGVLKRPDGNVSTEISIGVQIGGKETEIPTLVPSLSQKEIDHMLSGGDLKGEIGQSIVRKAVEHAKQRIAQGKSPFAQKGEYGLSRDQAIEYMRQANGDRTKAEEMARNDGYAF